MKVSGYWFTIGALTIIAAVVAWYEGANVSPSPVTRVLAVLLLGSLLLLCRALFLRLWREVARHAPHREAGRYARHASARIVAADTSSTDGSAPWFKLLKKVLGERHGWRWRYRQPWLLLTGDNKTIERLLPGLTGHDYLITDDAVLLWHARDRHGQPDEAWLKQLTRLRRHRPVDGLVLVTNGIEDTFMRTRGMSGPNISLARIAQTLHWSAPVSVLEAHCDALDKNATPIAGCEFATDAPAASMEADLLALRDQLAQLGVQRLGVSPYDCYVAKLSERLDGYAAPLAAWIAGLAARRLSVRGIFFTPLPAKATDGAGASDLLRSPLWSHLSRVARRSRGRRLHSHPLMLGAWIAITLCGVGISGMLVSAIPQMRDLRQTHAVIHHLDTAHDDVSQLRALLALQHRITAYEARTLHPVSWLLRFGLNEDQPVLDALWARYALISRTLLTVPVQLSLESALQATAHGRADVLQSDAAQRASYDALKAYRMLAEPARTEAAFLAGQIAHAWPMSIAMPPGEWQDSSQRLAAFFADHLQAHPDWRIIPSPHLVAAARNALIQQIGLANTDERIYQALLADVRDRYADVSLTTLLQGTDAQGLFDTSQTVPGMYTRAAWEGAVAKAIDQAAATQGASHDWVLADAAASAPATPRTTEALKARLTARYFAAYAAAWQRMLNSIRWQPAAHLSEAIDQLTRLTDAQSSPLIALMKSVRDEALVGRSAADLGDTLVHRARRLVGSDEAPATISAAAGPVEPAFAPLLALVGEPVEADRSAATATTSRSLQSFLTSATTLRLTLQKIAGSADAQAMAGTFAQAVFQGKLSELTQVREDAALTAAGLGSAWAGVAQALFVQPVESAWQAVLQPAAASLNEVWRDTLAAPFNRAFAGRYPFFDTPADASLAELGRFIRPETGLLPRFLATQLAGVLTAQGDQWGSNGPSSSSLTLDPAFLEAIQQLTALGAHMYVQGEARYRFDIMALPTPGVTRSVLSLDRQQIVYFNQREAWIPVAWPGDGLAGHTTLTWDTIEAGMRRPFDITGDWAFLRALEKADIQPLDSARYQITWTQPEKESQRYVLRTQLGTGPLELLKLRGFRLPEQIFAVGKPATARDTRAPLSTSIFPTNPSP